jgi:hypothetical protein
VVFGLYTARVSRLRAVEQAGSVRDAG